MPVSVITDVITWIELIAQIGVSTLELGVMSYLVFGGGWLDMIRLISFWLDNMIIKYTDVFYSYFEKILAGQIFAPDVVDGVMSKVYIFVSLIVLLKIMMLFIKYLINPEMVSDDKIGTHALVKRVLLGMCGMIALPYIFSFSVDVQEAVLNDNLFGQILLTKSELRTFEKNKGQVGRVLAFNVYQAFWNLDTSKVTSSSIKKKYNNAITAKDPGVIGSINEKFGEDYAYDYFPIASTVVLLYVIYLIIKYCLDVVVRMFKLFLLQMLGPLAISDYMINGDSKGVFKNWLNTTISVYAMLFVRIFSIWFIAFITILMQKECTTAGADGICTDSLLYVIKGQDPDYLLRGIITLGLLALLMDLPKFFSDILGLDLEQDATVKGLMQKVGGAAKMVGLGAATAGGAALGGAIGGLKGAASAGKNLAANKMQNKGKFDAKVGKMDSDYAKRLSDIKSNNTLTNRQKQQQMDSARKEWMDKNPNAQETADFKRANSMANKQATAAFTASAAGAARGGLTGLASAVPVLKEISGGYNQGQGAVDRQQSERSKGYEESRSVEGAYRKGMDIAASEIKTDGELTVDATVNGRMDNIENHAGEQEIRQRIIADASAAGQMAAEQHVQLVADGVDTSGVSVSPISVDATVNADTSNISVSPISVDATVNADTSNISVSPISVDATVNADTSNISVPEISVDAKVNTDVSNTNAGEVTVTADVETPEVNDVTASVNVNVSKTTTGSREISAFDDQFMDGNIDG